MSAPNDNVTRMSEQYPMRLPDGLRDRIKAEAAKNRRSMNAEYVSRIEATFADTAGKTLRDWFAGQALPGITFDCGYSVQEAAERAYEFADAMLAERAKADKP